MSVNVSEQQDLGEGSSNRIHDVYIQEFDDIKVSFQIIRLEKQVFVYVGLVSGTKLESMSMALPVAQKDPVSTIVLSKHDLNPESTKVSRVVCAKTGIPILASYNIPPGAVSDAVKNDIVAACVALVGTHSSA